MNVYDGIHWNIYEVLSYQRNFNFINGIRSIGKSYTGQKFFLDQAINKNKNFMYLVRTKDEKLKGAFYDGFKKVVTKEFSEYMIEFTTDTCILDDGENKRVLGYCYALSEDIQMKKKSFMDVYWIMFDEYMLEPKYEKLYVDGWKEPDHLLSIYHTIDREEDRVKVFCFGNNTKFYNPYHMHKAFKIPTNIKLGDIWASENVLFQWAKPSEKLKEYQKDSKFLRMISDTEYGNYANKGKYIGDNSNLVEKMEGSCTYNFTLIYEGKSFGVYSNLKKGRIYISNKVDKTCKLIYALTLDDHSENTLLLNSKITQLKWFATNFKRGIVRFTSMEVKAFIEPGITLLM